MQNERVVHGSLPSSCSSTKFRNNLWGLGLDLQLQITTHEAKNLLHLHHRFGEAELFEHWAFPGPLDQVECKAFQTCVLRIGTLYITLGNIHGCHLINIAQPVSVDSSECPVKWRLVIIPTVPLSKYQVPKAVLSMRCGQKSRILRFHSGCIFISAKARRKASSNMYARNTSSCSLSCVLLPSDRGR